MRLINEKIDAEGETLYEEVAEEVVTLPEDLEDFAIQSQEAYNFAETQEGWNAEEPPSCP